MDVGTVLPGHKVAPTGRTGRQGHKYCRARVGKREGRPGLRDDYAGHSPAAQDLARNSLVVVEARQIPQIVRDEAVPVSKSAGP